MADVSVSAKLPEEHIELLRRLAAENDRTMSAEIRIAVRNHLAGSKPPRREKVAK